MKTNREKYEHICSQIVAKEHAAIAALLPESVPAQFFIIEKYEARSIAVTGVKLSLRGFYMKSEDERISRRDIAEAIAVLDSWAMPTLHDLFVHYSYKETYGVVSGAYPYPKIGADANLAWDAEALTPEIDRRRLLYADREGHKSCAYCRKQTLESDMVSGTIIFRTQGGCARKTCLYCSDACHGYDQMGHEG